MSLALHSCSGFDYFQAAPLIKNSLIGFKDIQISKDYIDQQQYSFVKIKIGRSSPVILSLAFINDGIFEWVSADGERIYTLNGRIIRTDGLVHNFNLLTEKTLPKKDSLPAMQSRLIELTSPDATTMQTSRIEIEREDRSIISINEKVETSSFNWNYINTYIVDKDLELVTHSVQHIHPKLSEFKIQFFYKF